jgi:hypothetical protein
MPNLNYALLGGVVLPPTDGSYKKEGEISENDDFTPEEYANVNIKGIPLVFTHWLDKRDKKAAVIGKFVNQYIRPSDGALIGVAAVPTDNLGNQAALVCIKNGGQCRLSMSHELVVYGMGGQITRKEKVPVDIAVVDEGRFDGDHTRVLFVIDHEGRLWSDDGKGEVFLVVSL